MYSPVALVILRNVERVFRDITGSLKERRVSVLAVGADEVKRHEGNRAGLHQEVIRCVIGMHKIESPESQHKCFKEQVQNKEVLSKKSLDSCNSLLCLEIK